MTREGVMKLISEVGLYGALQEVTADEIEDITLSEEWADCEESINLLQDYVDPELED